MEIKTIDKIIKVSLMVAIVSASLLVLLFVYDLSRLANFSVKTACSPETQEILKSNNTTALKEIGVEGIFSCGNITILNENNATIDRTIRHEECHKTYWLNGDAHNCSDEFGLFFEEVHCYLAGASPIFSPRVKEECK